MSERNRPLGTPEELARSLIASARLDVQPAPVAVRDVILVSISTVGALGGGSALAGASWAALRRLGLVKWLAATAILSTAGVGAYLAINRAPSTSASRAREHEQALAHSNPPPVALPSASEGSGMPASPGPEAPESETSSPTLPALRHRAAPSKATSSDKVSASEVSSLEGEVAALDRARSRLAAGDPLRTLELLDGYEQAFPRGALRPEASYLRIQALSKSGQREAARALAARFLASHPKSPHAAQLQALLSP